MLCFPLIYGITLFPFNLCNIVLFSFVPFPNDCRMTQCRSLSCIIFNHFFLFFSSFCLFSFFFFLLLSFYFFYFFLLSSFFSQIDGAKGNRILSDPEVKGAIEKRRQASDDFVLLQESFTCNQELLNAKINGTYVRIHSQEFPLFPFFTLTFSDIFIFPIPVILYRKCFKFLSFLTYIHLLLKHESKTFLISLFLSLFLFELSETLFVDFFVWLVRFLKIIEILK